MQNHASQLVFEKLIKGFRDGFGCFIVEIYNSKSSKRGFAIGLRFKLVQNNRDQLLINNCVEYLNCGSISIDNKNSAVSFYVTKLGDINDKILPFFDQYNLQSYKKLDYGDFCLAAHLMQNKSHLTASGIEQIRLIKSRMNSKRDHNS